jgi:hypothetical protein
MGFLTSSIQVRARYRRCKDQWQGHLVQTRRAILSAARRATRRRKAVVFGAGLLHDIPLQELSEMFESVVLVDVVHTWPCRLRAAAFANVKLLGMDVTGVVAQIAKLRSRPALPMPVSRPMELTEDRNLDFAVSVNLLSQLSWVPGRVLRGVRPEAEGGVGPSLITTSILRTETTPREQDHWPRRGRRRSTR